MPKAEYYWKNRDKVIKAVKEYQTIHPEQVRQYKWKHKYKKKLLARAYVMRLRKNGHCAICGLKDWRCLDFHHIEKKKKKHEISQLCNQGYTIGYISKEIQKCLLLCRNCHIENTPHMVPKIGRKIPLKNRLMREYKQKVGCSRCQNKNSVVLQFHHIDKTNRICVGHTSSVKKMKEELLKCIVLCGNCHLITHYELKHGICSN